MSSPIAPARASQPSGAARRLLASSAVAASRSDDAVVERAERRGGAGRARAAAAGRRGHRLLPLAVIVEGAQRLVRPRRSRTTAGRPPVSSVARRLSSVTWPDDVSQFVSKVAPGPALDQRQGLTGLGVERRDAGLRGGQGGGVRAGAHLLDPRRHASQHQPAGDQTDQDGDRGTGEPEVDVAVGAPGQPDHRAAERDEGEDPGHGEPQQGPSDGAELGLHPVGVGVDDVRELVQGAALGTQAGAGLGEVLRAHRQALTVVGPCALARHWCRRRGRCSAAARAAPSAGWARAACATSSAARVMARV